MLLYDNLRIVNVLLPVNAVAIAFAPSLLILLADKSRFVNVVLPVNAVAKAIAPSILISLSDKLRYSNPDIVVNASQNSLSILLIPLFDKVSIFNVILPFNAVAKAFAPSIPMLLSDKLRFVNVILPVNAVANSFDPSILILLFDKLSSFNTRRKYSPSLSLISFLSVILIPVKLSVCDVVLFFILLINIVFCSLFSKK